MKAGRNTLARQMAILEVLQKDGRALVDDLSARFETTPQTIRKDLSALAEVNQISRFHGGAALVGGTTTLIEMCCPSRDDDPWEAFQLWKLKAEGKAEIGRAHV